MQTVTIDDIEDVPQFTGANSTRKPLSRVLGELGFGVVYFELAPGEATGGTAHTHLDQEELFVVLDGTVTFSVREEPTDDPEEVFVSAGEAIHFTPEDVFQSGTNEGNDPATVFALGVPGARHDWADVRAVAACPDCGHETAHRVVPDEETERMPDAESVTMVCTACGTEH